MSTGIQGPQGSKGARGLQGASGWGSIGSDIGPTGPTGTIGTYSLFSTVTTTVTLTASAVSTLYSLTSSTLTVTNGGGISPGGFFVLSNRGTTACATTLAFPMTVNGSAVLGNIPIGGSVTLVYSSGNNFISV